MNRRDIILAASAAPALAIAATPAAALASRPCPSDALQAVLDRHTVTADAFDVAIRHANEIRRAYEAAQGDTVIVPCFLGGGMGMSNGREACRAHVSEVYGNQRHRLPQIMRLDPDLGERLRETLDRREVENLELVDRMFAEEEARREAFGLAEAERRESEADAAEQEAAMAVLSYRCRTLGEVVRRAAYLQTGPLFSTCLLTEEQAEALLDSMVEADA